MCLCVFRIPSLYADHYLNPLAFQTKPETRRKLRIALSAAMLFLLLYIRRSYRLGSLIEKEYQVFIRDTLKVSEK